MQQNEWDLPDPPGVHPVRGPRFWKWIIAGVIVAALAAAAYTVPLSAFYAYLPGPVRDVEKLVKVSGTETYSSEGQLLLTTVSVDIEVTFVDWIKDSFDPNAIIVGRDSVTGGQSFEKLEKDQLAAMDESKQHAQEVALSALGVAHPTSEGVRVTALVNGSPAATALEVGDIVEKIDGRAVKTSCEVGSTIGPKEPGEEVELTIRRDGRSKTLEIGTIPDPQDPSAAIVGVGLEDIGYDFEAGMDIEFATGEIAGPSAGLMFTLALYDRLTPEDLTAGKLIAGTGTIACDGQVGPIGGIQQKIAGAEANGAEIFLAPAGNYEDAKAAADEMDVVRVSNFEDALSYLETLE